MIKIDFKMKANWYTTIKNSMEVLSKLKIELPYNPAIPLLGIYPGKTIICKDTCTPVFTTALFIITKTQKQPSYPSVYEGVKMR